MNNRPKILFLVTEDWYFCSHRLPLARACREKGFDVVVVTNVNDHREAIERENLRLIHLPVVRGSLNLVRDLGYLFSLFRIYKREQPDLVHHVAMKPMLYGTLAARLAEVPRVVNAAAGMGYLFIEGGFRLRLLRSVMTSVLRFLLDGTTRTLIVQNPDDARFFEEVVKVKHDRIVLIRGSGVDLTKFAPCPGKSGGVPLATLVSRLLWHKGVGEFVEAARILKAEHVSVRMALVGAPDDANAAAVDRETLAAWKQEGVVELWGHRDDIPTVYAETDIAVLPSYREGVPKSLLEAAASGLPIVATDTTGCREVVDDRVNGLLIPVKDSKALAGAIRRLVENRDMRMDMGRKSREKAEKEFALERVVSQTLDVYRALLDAPRSDR